jgi:DNA-3-methyladenine glycosylase
VSGRSRAPKVLPRAFYARPTLDVARDLIGKVLVHLTADGVSAGAIVEAEAYVGEGDPACHASAGPTRRNRPLYGDPGRAYVYFNYGVHYLANAVTERRGFPAAVLIRALVPLEGTDLMRQRRGRRRDGTELPEHHLCRGPGNLTSALGIGPAQNEADLTSGPPADVARWLRANRGRPAASRLWIEDRGIVVERLVWTPRIGIRVGTDVAWRCCAAGHPAVSGGRRETWPSRGRGSRDDVVVRRPRATGETKP